MDPAVMGHLASLNHQAQAQSQAQYENVVQSCQQQQQFPPWTPPQLSVRSPSSHQAQQLVDEIQQVDPISLSFTPSPEELNPKDF